VLNYIVTGIVGSLAVAGGLYLNIFLSAPEKTAQNVETHASKLEQLDTEISAVPALKDGKVAGYFVIKVSSTIDRSAMKQALEDLSPFLNEAVLIAAVDFASGSITEVKPSHLKALTKQILVNAEENFGASVVKDVRIEQFNFVPQAEVRDNLFKVK
jgi:flagellar basal body-associated protein FliL